MRFFSKFFDSKREDKDHTFEKSQEFATLAGMIDEDGYEEDDMEQDDMELSDIDDEYDIDTEKKHRDTNTDSDYEDQYW